MKTLVLLSGGLDSAVVLDLMRERGEVAAVLFDYGQPHSIELDYARALAASQGIAHRTVKLPPMPLVNDVVFAGRNLVLASHAISIAAAEGFQSIAMGCNQSDWERFPDCRPAFWKAVNATAEAYGVSVALPLLRMTKAQVVQLAKARGVAIDRTWSCYNPQFGKPCGKCLACHTRAEAGA